MSVRQTRTSNYTADTNKDRCQKFMLALFWDVGLLCDTTSLKFSNLTNLPTDTILKTKGSTKIRNPEPKTGIQIQRNP